MLEEITVTEVWPKGHPSDKCLHVCAACGEIHDCGKCPIEEFNNFILKWYVPNKHAGIFTPKVEEKLN